MEGDVNKDVNVCFPRTCCLTLPYTYLYPSLPPSLHPLSPELLSSSEHAARLQRSEVLEECEQGGQRCYTLQSVERVMKQVG